MSASVNGSRAGHPSITTPTPRPWDSPNVLARNRVPKVLNIASAPCRCLHLDHSCHFFKTSGRSKPTQMDLDLKNEGGMVILFATHRIGAYREGDVRARS
jgi:hypothetical protein